jgi:hypothetical protein
MGIYIYDQNNSGGRFTGPARKIIVEAPDAETADGGAEIAGAYFDGAGDCPCCGDRWSRAYGEPDFATLEEAIASTNEPGFMPEIQAAWDEEAGGKYVVVRMTSPVIQRPEDFSS